MGLRSSLFPLRPSLVILLAALCSITHQNKTHAATLPNIPHVLGNTVRFSYVMPGAVMGIDQEPITQPQIARLKKLTAGYIQFRRGRLSAKDKMALFTQCLAEGAENPYCEFIPARMPKQRGPAAKSGTAPIAAMAELVQAIEGGDLASIGTAANPRYFRALRKFSDWKDLEPVTLAALSSESACPPPEFLLSLGLKAEEFLPEVRFRDLALSLYERSRECSQGSKDPIVELAAFRAALLHIWRGNCDKALPILGEIAQNSDTEFWSRARYWQTHCAGELKLTVESDTFREELVGKMPMAYHSLIVSRDRPGMIQNRIQSQDPEVSLRLPYLGEINRWLVLAELLIEQGEGKLADDILARILKSETQMEPEFRLYVAALASRAGLTITSFRLLAGVFNDRAEYISEGTLKLFFPLKYFDLIWEQRGMVDPYLAAALIRQESGFDPAARSSAGARGLMQLMPQTARRMAHVSNETLHNPGVSIKLGTRYFRGLLDRFQGDAELALAAYNAGERNLDSWRSRYPTDNRALFLDLIPFTETRNYVALISRNYYWYTSLYGGSGLVVRKTSSIEEQAHLFPALQTR